MNMAGTLGIPLPTPVEIADPINAAILSISEDKLQGFSRRSIR